MRTRACAFVAAVALAVSMTATTAHASAGSTVLYEADWSGGMNGWAGPGSWKTLDGVLLNDGTTNGVAAIIAPYVPGSRANYAIEADVRIIADAYDPAIGVMARLDSGGGYAGVIGSNQRTSIAPWNDLWRPMAEGRSFDPQRAWHRYRLQVKGNVVTFAVDSAVLASAPDNRWLAGGSVGLWSYHYQIEVRRFRVLTVS